MAQKLNVFGPYGTEISESIAEFAVQHSNDGVVFEPTLRFKHTKRGDADGAYLQFQARDTDLAAAMGVSGEDAFAYIREPATAKTTIVSGVSGNVLERVTFGLPSGEAVSTGIIVVPVPKNMSCDAIRVIYYAPTSGELDLAAAMN